MDQADHRNNFDAIRLAAALGVLYSHSFPLHGSADPKFMTLSTLGTFWVYVFFAMSGFLVTRSWLSDPHILRFLLRRALRIFPALIGVVLLSALVLGPLVTDLSPTAYLTHRTTYGYLRNGFLLIVYVLPGVFTHNPYPLAVNGCLWSLPVEFFMYCLVLLFGLTPLIRSKWPILVITIAFAVAGQYLRVHHPENIVYAYMDIRQIFFTGGYFFAGAAIYLYRDRVTFSATAIVLVFSLGLAVDGGPLIQYWGPLAVPFAVIAVCLRHERWLHIPERFGDLSYGIYLYGFPVQQTVEFLWHDRLTVALAFCIELALTCLCAFLSWHLLEKHALRLKPRACHPRRSALEPREAPLAIEAGAELQ